MGFYFLANKGYVKIGNQYDVGEYHFVRCWLQVQDHFLKTCHVHNNTHLTIYGGRKLYECNCVYAVLQILVYLCRSRVPYNGPTRLLVFNGFRRLQQPQRPIHAACMNVVVVRVFSKYPFTKTLFVQAPAELIVSCQLTISIAAAVKHTYTTNLELSRRISILGTEVSSSTISVIQSYSI